METITSNFHLFAIGVVLEDKKPNSDVLYAEATEWIDGIDGDISQYTRQVGDIEATNRWRCVWTGFDDMRATAPDMVKGEKVLIYRKGDSDTYFWESGGRNASLRNKEHVTWILSNTTGDTQPDASNQLYITASTRDGYMTVTTPTNDGEATGYNLILNFKEGELSWKDDNGYGMYVDSKTGHARIVMDEITYQVRKINMAGDASIGGLLTVGRRIQSALVKAGSVIAGAFSKG
jgi:hypothetical protein